MPSPDVQIGVAALLEQCAQRRAGMIAAPYQDDPSHIARMLQAEAAGRELMAALVRPEPFPDLRVAATLRRLVGYLQTVLAASTADEQLAPMLTTRLRQVAVCGADAATLCAAAVLLVLAAIDDDAQDVEIRLEAGPLGTVLTVESDAAGVAAELPAVRALRDSIAQRGGMWDVSRAPHRASWMVVISLPTLAQERAVPPTPADAGPGSVCRSDRSWLHPDR